MNHGFKPGAGACFVMIARIMVGIAGRCDSQGICVGSSVHCAFVGADNEIGLSHIGGLCKRYYEGKGEHKGER